jgi:3-hydroxymyristoyl/3-hydroxydecanoyl-(acyl carrier protein) dehydratase
MNSWGSSESCATSLILAFDESDPVFRDHFPGVPLVPAFMQLAAIRQNAAVHCQCPPECVVLRAVKFLRPLAPHQRAILRLQRLERSNTLQFEIVADEELVTHGDLLFG